MKKWEYCSRMVGHSDFTECHMFNKLGLEGWELTGTVVPYSPTMSKVYLRREVQEIEEEVPDHDPGM